MLIRAILEETRILPVLTVRSAAEAVSLARALIAGGVSTVEVTLRTSVAFDAIRAIHDEVPGCRVGVGTVVGPGQFDLARKAGAMFAVSPCHSDSLLDAAAASGLTYLPGVATVSEALRLREKGFLDLKLFPSELLGGRALLGALGTVLPDIRFCPTGGIANGMLRDYLALPNVTAVGGSWLSPRESIEAEAWSSISEMARAAVRTAAEISRPLTGGRESR